MRPYEICMIVIGAMMFVVAMVTAVVAIVALAL